MEDSLYPAPIRVGNISGVAIAIGHGASATVNVLYQHARPRPVRADELAAAQQRLDSLPLDSIPDPDNLPAGSNRVFARNRLFTGRASDLQQLARALKGQSALVAIGQIAAATGLGGIGKTQLAVEFAHRYGRYFAGGVFWLSFASSADVKNQIALCGGVGGMQLRGDYEVLKLDEQVALVLSEWQSPLPRLLIFDNCESEALLQQWRPPTGGCRVLLTSRNAEWDLTLGVQTLALGVLKRSESVALLRKFRPDLTSVHELSGLEAVAEELGDLPLALHLAGSFLSRYHVSVSDLLANLRQPDLLTHASLTGMGLTISPTGHENHVARTFALSYLRLKTDEAVDAVALRALARVACFAPGLPIPRILLKQTLGDVQPELQAEEALHRLAELGLIEVGENGTLTLHRLLANFVQRTDPDPTAFEAVVITLDHEAHRVNESGLPDSLRPWAAHLRHVTEQALGRENEMAGPLFSELGYYLYHVADYKDAQAAYQRALEIDQAMAAPDQSAISRDLNNLGTALKMLGDVDGAMKVYREALAIDESAFGAYHLNVAFRVNNLAVVLYESGHYAEARAEFERALGIFEDQLEAEDPRIATLINNLGNVFQNLGDNMAARQAFERSLSLTEAALGPDHPKVAVCLNNLGRLLEAFSDPVGARAVYERALRIFEHTLGPQHPHVATVVHNLGMLLQKMGDNTGARAAYERAFRIRVDAFGPDHSATRVAWNSLANLLNEPARLTGFDSGPQ